MRVFIKVAMQMSRVGLGDDKEIHEVVILDADELGLVNIEIAFVGLQ